MGMILLVCGVAGCAPELPEPVYAVRRSALISHPAPVMRSGAPIDGRVRFQLDDSTVIVPIEPVETAGANTGLYIARHNIGSGVRLRITESFDFGLRFQTALLRGAMAVAEDPIPPPDGTVYEFGTSLNWSGWIAGRFHIGFAVDLLLSISPIREERRCVSNCMGAGRHGVLGEERTIVMGTFSVLPSYQWGPVLIFAGLSGRNHPTNTGAEVLSETGLDSDDHDELRSGPGYLLVGGGIESRLGGPAKVLAQVYQPISTEVARYGPVLGISVSFDLGRRSGRTERSEPR